MTNKTIEPVLLVLDCHPDDHALIVTAADGANMEKEDYCKRAIQLSIRQNLIIPSGARTPEAKKEVTAAMIERGLRASLSEGRGLKLHYQPQVDMLTGDVIGAEALVRWEFNGGIVYPADFIPVAESSGLIVQIGEWVLLEACREARRWHSMGLGGERGIKVGVNLSVKQFSDSLPQLVHSILWETGLPTNLLGLEITESFLVGNGSLDMLHALRDSGIHLSIDDFGIGYSCLAQLKDLPLDTIKIDRAFVQDLGKGRKAAVVETIIDLAKKLGMATLAEGVETLAQAEALIGMGCSVCQGHLYSGPISGERFVAFAGGVSKIHYGIRVPADMPG